MYHAFGLAISSEFSLASLPTWVGEGQPHIRIQKTKNLESQGFKQVTPTLSWHPDGKIQLCVPAIAGYEISRSEIQIVQGHQAVSADIELFLLSSAMAILAHLRGFIPLTASCVRVAGGCVLFMGRACSGKSLIALGLRNAGLNVISDDLVWLSVDPDGVPRAFSGCPELRVWRDSFAAIGVANELAAPIRQSTDKFRVPLTVKAQAAPLPIVAVYHLIAKPESKSELIADMSQSRSALSFYNCADQKLIADRLGLIDRIKRWTHEAAHTTVNFQYSSKFSTVALSEELAKLRKNLS